MDKFGISGMYTLSALVDDPEQGKIRAAGVDLQAGFTGEFFSNTPLRLEAIAGASTSASSAISLNVSTDQSIRAVFLPDVPVGNIIINEVSASNAFNHADGYGEYNDWIEIYNGNGFNVNLAGWYLTDTTGYEGMYQIPFGFPEQTIIGAGEYLVICSCTRKPGRR